MTSHRACCQTYRPPEATTHLSVKKQSWGGRKTSHSKPSGTSCLLLNCDQMSMILWSCFDMPELVFSLGLSCCIPMWCRSERLSGPSLPSRNPLASLCLFIAPLLWLFLFSHPYSSFLHIYISLFSKVRRSLIFQLRLLPWSPEGGTGPGTKGRAFPQLKILGDLDDSVQHGHCTTRCLHQPELEACVTKTDMQNIAAGSFSDLLFTCSIQLILHLLEEMLPKVAYEHKSMWLFRLSEEFSDTTLQRYGYHVLYKMILDNSNVHSYSQSTCRRTRCSVFKRPWMFHL